MYLEEPFALLLADIIAFQLNPGGVLKRPRHLHLSRQLLPEAALHIGGQHDLQAGQNFVSKIHARQTHQTMHLVQNEE